MRKPIAGFAFACLVLLPLLMPSGFAADSVPSATPIQLPLTIVQSNPVTTITIGEQTIPVIVDTGGGELLLSKAVLDRAGAVSLDGSVVSTNASGQEFEHPRYRVPVVTIGGQVFRDMVAIQAPESEGLRTPNVIGRQFLSRFLVVVDYENATITLWLPETKNLPRTKCGRTRIPMKHTAEDTQLAVSDFKTDAGRIRLLWDTGATYSMIPETLAETLQIPTRTRGPGSPPFFQSSRLSVAGRDFGPVEFVVLPLKLTADFDGLLGGNFFERHVVCLDYARREVRVR